MSDSWRPDFIENSALFTALAPAYAPAWRDKSAWPAIADYNQQVAQQRKPVCNHLALPISFIEQGAPAAAFADGYEPRIYLRGEVSTRAGNWHDFFNMLVWLTFPQIKAAVNYWQYQALQQRWPTQKTRTPLENRLTHLDENGVIILSSDAELIELLQDRRWQTLFWQARARVKTSMRFFVFGHALYEKALSPYIGLTGSALIFQVGADFFTQSLLQQLDFIDTMVSRHVYQPGWLMRLNKLAPIPLLGVPGWWQANNVKSFYENKDYFRG